LFPLVSESSQELGMAENVMEVSVDLFADEDGKVESSQVSQGLEQCLNSQGKGNS